MTTEPTNPTNGHPDTDGTNGTDGGVTGALRSPELTLNDPAHTVIPQIGFGTFQIPAEDTQRAVEEALEIGYRHIDTAAAYYNEEAVGAALKATGMAGRVFVATKLRNCDQGYDQALIAFEESRRMSGDLAVRCSVADSSGLWIRPIAPSFLGG